MFAKVILLKLCFAMLLCFMRSECYDMVPNEENTWLQEPVNNMVEKNDKKIEDNDFVPRYIIPSSTQPLPTVVASEPFFRTTAPTTTKPPTPFATPRLRTTPSSRATSRFRTPRRFPTSRFKIQCPIDCGKACVVRRRSFFVRGYVCILPIQSGCQRCCSNHERCRLSKVPDWVCYQQALDCVCHFRSRYRNIHCFGRNRCLQK